MNTSKYRHVLTFQIRSEASDGLGPGGIVSWADALSLWGAVWGMNASERIEAARNKLNAQYRIRTRRNALSAQITSTMRIKWQDGANVRYLEVLSIHEIGDRRLEYEIIAQEKT